MKKQHGVTVGIVKNNADPAQHGRLQVYVPTWDADDFQVDELPWCMYVTPFGGSTVDMVAGREEHKLAGVSAYGMWAVPKVGAQVLVTCLDGNPEVRLWFGCLYMPEYNRTLPQGIEGVLSELDDSGQFGQHTFEHMQENLTDAGLWRSDAHWRTRGGWARSVSHPSNKNSSKPTDNGYSPNPSEPSKADSQIYSLTTPGHHYIELSDVKDESRVRIKTAEGNQVLLDDTNERIYISTAKGRNWIELDETNGKIYVYSDSKVSIRGRNDVNIYSDENINIVAKKRVNIQSESRGIALQATHAISMLSSSGDLLFTASRGIQLKTLNGLSASAVSEATSCEAPAWHGNPGGKGLVRDWAEAAGSASSSIRLDSAQEVTALAQGAITLMSATKLSLRSAGQLSASGSNFNGTFSSTRWSVDNTGFKDSRLGAVTATGGAEAPETAPPVQAVKFVAVGETMLKPDHESWTRDEDEGACPTTRGPNYQG